MKVKEGLSLKQINEAIEILESTEGMVDLAYAQAKASGSKSIKNTEAFVDAKERVTQVCAMMGIETPAIFRDEAEEKKLYE